MEQDFYKVRSYSSCLVRGFKVYADNLWVILKYSWSGLLLFSFCLTLVSFLYKPFARFVLAQAEPEMMPYIPQLLFLLTVLVLLVVSVLASSLFGGQITVLFREYMQSGKLAFRGHGTFYKASLMPAGKLLAFSFIFLLKVAFLSGGFHWLFGFSLWTWFWDIVMLLVVYIPFGAFVITQMAVPGKISWNLSILKDLFQHWGAWSAVFFVSGLFCLVCTLLFFMPAFVLFFARSEAYFMELGGDVADLPIYFNLMQFFVTMLSAVLSLHLFASMYFSLFFLYGSIEKQRQEQQTYNEEQKRLLL